MRYQVFKLRDPSRPGTVELLGAIEQQVQPFLEDQPADIFGVFTSLLGLASNELYLVTSGETLSLPGQTTFDVIETTTLLPTIRPLNREPATKPGVYVFRWFTVAPSNVDEIVRLSGEAWPSFEADFDAEVQGLFVEESDLPELMLLITWYRDLTAWQTSRAPSPDARENFLKRHRLTRRALPIATQLHVPGERSTLVSHR